MGRSLPRLVSCAVLATMLTPLLPARLFACVAPPPDPCVRIWASSDEPNPRFPNCADLISGSFLDTAHPDCVYEVVRLTGTGCTSTPPCGEWIWVFDNVPAGPRYLKYGGHSGQNKYILQIRSCDAGHRCPSDQLPCPTDRYADVDTIMPGTGPDTVHIKSLGSSNYVGRVCVLLQKCGSCGSSCSTPDQVSMDFLMITNDPSCTEQLPDSPPPPPPPPPCNTQ
jgi:hypothetical protein